MEWCVGKYGKAFGWLEDSVIVWGGGGVGRITLIKSMLSSLPTYHLSLFPIPLGVANLWRNYKELFYGESWEMNLSFTW